MNTMNGDGDADLEAQPTSQSQHREGRGWRLCVIVALQSAVVASCCAFSLYVYWLVEQQDHTYIEFDSYTGSRGDDNGTLTFAVSKSYQISCESHKDGSGKLVKAAKIKVECRGPYLLHMTVCVKNLDEEPEGNGTLKLSREGSEVLANFELHGKEKVCRWLHTTVYLKENEDITLRFHSALPDLKIVEMRMGFSYLLGTQCL